MSLIVPGLSSSDKYNLSDYQHDFNEINASLADMTANVKQYGAILDGTTHPLSEKYQTLEQAQTMRYPHATSLIQEIDWCAIQGVINYLDGIGGGQVLIPNGKAFIGNDSLLIKNKICLTGISGINTTSTQTDLTAYANSVIIYKGSSSAIKIGDSVTYSCKGALIKNLSVDGNGIGVNGIEIAGSGSSWSGGNYVEKVNINNFTGVGIQFTTKCWSNTIKDSSIKNCNIGVCCIEQANATTLDNIDINICTIGIKSGNGSSTNIQNNIRINNCTIQGCTTGIEKNAPTWLLNIEKAYIEGCITPIVINTGYETNINNCNIDGGTNEQIKVNVGAGLNVQGCFFTGSPANYIFNFVAGSQTGIIANNKNVTGKPLYNSITTNTFFIEDEINNISNHYTKHRNFYMISSDSDVNFQRSGEAYPRVKIDGSGKIIFSDGVTPTMNQFFCDHSTQQMNLYQYSLRLREGTWNTGHLIMGTYHIWVDSSLRLRIKSGVPTSETDGTIIGTQS